MMNDINSEKLLDFMSNSLERLHPDDIAFLFATGKNELLFRDMLASYMSRKLLLEKNEFVAREWKKHDLAVVRESEPLILIEGKSWIHYDAANKVKLARGPKSVKAAMETDIEKMRRQKKKHPAMRSFITNILFTVEVKDNSPLEYGHLTYGQYHRQGGRKLGSFDALASKGVSNLVELMSDYGVVAHASFPIGKYSDMHVHLDFFVMEVD